jgi:hypothetical protein
MQFSYHSIAAAAIFVTGVLSQAADERKPILTTDIISDTADLVYDVGGHFYGSYVAHHVDKIVDKHHPTVMKALDDGLTAVCEKTKLTKPETVYAKHQEFKEKATQLKATVAEKSSVIKDKLDAKASQLVDKFEAAMPKHKGLIPKNILDVLLFVSYLAFVMYLMMKVMLFFKRLFCSVFCYFCCFGCLRSKSSGHSNNTNGSSTGKKAADSGKKSTKKGK